MKTKHEIIDEIAGHYSLKNRSVDGINSCVYNGPNGELCAFAYMCLNPASLTEGQDAEDMIMIRGQDILKEEYRGHPQHFYLDIQSLHDAKENWTDVGLSAMGKIKVRDLKEMWS